MMPLIFVVALVVVLILAICAWRLTGRVREQDAIRHDARADTRQSIEILIGSYLQQQVDRSECLLRMRVLLDAGFSNWREPLSSEAFETVSNALLAMPYGQARAKLTADARRDEDARRRQLLQLHEADLEVEIKQLQEWLAQ